MNEYLPGSSIRKVAGSTYILIIYLAKPFSVMVGKLGFISFERGYYLYIGSAKKYLRTRLLRHLSRLKKKFWHIDYVLSDPCPSFIVDIMINVKACECTISQKLYKNSTCKLVKKGFGSSDCHCISHFFQIKEDDALKNLIKMLNKEGFSSIKNS
jgi:Uri superfamily endonuclease